MPSLPSPPPMTYEWPLLLWSLLLIPVFLGLYVLAQRRRRAYAVRFTNLALLRDVVGRRPGFRRHLPPLLFVLGIGALLFSLARPSAVIAVPREQADVMLVVDTSGSMTATDLRPSRIEAARQAAGRFVQSLPPTARVGVIEFSTRARVASPLTRDREVVMSAIKSLDADGGTAIGRWRSRCCGGTAPARRPAPRRGRGRHPGQRQRQHRARRHRARSCCSRTGHRPRASRPSRPRRARIRRA
jgi:hypothetical protein